MFSRHKKSFRFEQAKMMKQCFILLRCPKANGIGCQRSITNSLLASRRNIPTYIRQSFFSTNRTSIAKGGRPTKESLKSSKHNKLPKFLEPTNPFFNKPLIPSFDPNLSLSILAGHSAFVLTGLGYLTSDILILRLWACGGISLSMLFQYYRPQPLKIPIVWNSLFLGINVVWATLLYQERQEAKSLGDELESVYVAGEFEKRRVSRVDFKRLFVDLARREVRQRGDVLKEEGHVTQQLYDVDFFNSFFLIIISWSIARSPLIFIESFPLWRNTGAIFWMVQQLLVGMVAA